MRKRRVSKDSRGSAAVAAKKQDSPITAAVKNDARRMWVRSARERQELKRSMLEERKRVEERKSAARMSSMERWRRRMERSPFAVDLLAEHERMDEEQRVRLREETRRMKAVERRKERVKTEIIVRALSEASDVEALRAEKREILLEEKRLRALLEAEKVKLHRKADQQAAVRAERHRQRAKREFRRRRFAAFAKEREFAVRTAEMERLGLIYDPSQKRAVSIDSEAGRVALQAALRAGKWLPGMPLEEGGIPPEGPGEYEEEEELEGQEPQGRVTMDGRPIADGEESDVYSGDEAHEEDEEYTDDEHAQEKEEEEDYEHDFEDGALALAGKD